MTRSTYMKFSFNGGELSPLLDGRVDYPKYSSGAKEMTNFVPTVYGPMTKRPGTRFVNELPQEASLYPFEFNQTQSYILAFCEDGFVYFYSAGGVVVDGGGVNQLKLAHQYSGFTRELKIAQTGDVAYITHPEAGISKLSRTGANSFTLEQDYTFMNGPFEDDNLDVNNEVTVTNLSGSGQIGDTVTAVFDNIPASIGVGSLIRFYYIPSTRMDTWTPESHDFSGADIEYDVGDFLTYQDNVYEVKGVDPSADPVPTLPVRTGTRAPLHDKGTEGDGNLLLEFKGDEYGYIEVTSVSTNTVQGTIRRLLPKGLIDGDPTDDWAPGAIGGNAGFPNALTFHQQRLVIGGIPNTPQTIYGSVIGDIENFDAGTNDDDSYTFKMAATKRNPIEWIASNVDMQVGTIGSEFSVTGNGGAITPTNVNVKQITTYGSQENTRSLVTNGFNLFIQSGGNKVRELRFDEGTQRNFARDLNKVSEHIARGGIRLLSYQGEPYQVVWSVIGTELYGLTYETDEDVYAWHRQSVGEVISIEVIPNQSSDRLWLCVKRNGSYYIEYLTDFFERNDDIVNAVFVDSSLEYSGAPTTTVTGLDHLEGELVNVLGDGSVEPSRVVTGGSVTLQNASSRIIVGLPIKSAWQSMRLEGGSQEGIGQGKAKHLKNVIFRLDATGSGLFYGRGDYQNGLTYFANDSRFPVRAAENDMDAPPPLISGDTELLGFEGGWDKSFFVRLEHEQPTPCTIISFMSQVQTNER